MGHVPEQEVERKKKILFFYFYSLFPKSYKYDFSVSETLFSNQTLSSSPIQKPFSANPCSSNRFPSFS
jgi:hypothetical protein